MTTTFQILTVVLVLFTGYYPAFKQISIIAVYGTAIMTILSGTHYIYIGTRILNEKKSQPII
jgi:phosphatidylglycerophosphate synthase